MINLNKNGRLKKTTPNLWDTKNFFRNFDDYSDFQQKSRGDKNMNNTVATGQWPISRAKPVFKQKFLHSIAEQNLD